MSTTEEYNYRVALKDALQKRLELKVAIAARKKELHAVEKRIVEMNRQYAEGDYTGELFSQAEAAAKKDEQPNNLIEREDGLTFNIFLKMIQHEMEDYLDEDYFTQGGFFHAQAAAVLDFVEANPQSATAFKMFQNDLVTYKDDDRCSWEIYPGQFGCQIDKCETPDIVDREDYDAFQCFLEKWQKIMTDRHEKWRAENDKKTKKKSKGANK